MKYEDYLSSIYYDPGHPASFSALDKLFRIVRKEGKFVLSKAKIKSWLMKQEAYSLHRGIIRKQRRQKIVVPYIDYQWEIDTAYMTSYGKQNDGYAFFLLIIEAFSKFVWTAPLKRIQGEDVSKAFKSILRQEGRHCERLRSDYGSEYKSLKFQNLLKREGIKHFYSLNETKAALAERAIKTIKSKIARYMSKHQTHRWIDILKDVTQSYNQTYHRAIKKAPIDVKKSDQAALWNLKYNSLPRVKRSKTTKGLQKYMFKVGDNVRISGLRKPFQREYDERWTIEYFIVSQRGKKEEIPYYKLQDIQLDPIRGTFYNNELSKVVIDNNSQFRIRKILRRRKNEVLVSWMGWPAKFNSYIPVKHLKTFQHS